MVSRLLIPFMKKSHLRSQVREDTLFALGRNSFQKHRPGLLSWMFRSGVEIWNLGSETQYLRRLCLLPMHSWHFLVAASWAETGGMLRITELGLSSDHHMLHSPWCNMSRVSLLSHEKWHHLAFWGLYPLGVWPGNDLFWILLLPEIFIILENALFMPSLNTTLSAFLKLQNTGVNSSPLSWNPEK